MKARSSSPPKVLWLLLFLVLLAVLQVKSLALLLAPGSLSRGGQLQREITLGSEIWGTNSPGTSGSGLGLPECRTQKHWLCLGVPVKQRSSTEGLGHMTLTQLKCATYKSLGSPLGHLHM